MAAVEINTLSTALIGVDATRLAAVAAWPSGTTHASVVAVGRALTPRTAPDVILANGALGVSAAVSASGAASRDLAHLHLEAWLFDPMHGSRTIDLGTLRRGRSIYQGVPQAGCPCRLTGIGVLPNAKRVPSSGHIQLGLDALTYRSGQGAPQSARATSSTESKRCSTNAAS